MHKLPVGVLGASGYAGRELCALIAAHPRLELQFASANERRGDSATFGGKSLSFVAPDDAPLGAAALVFTALPHGASAPWVARASAAGARVVDLSSDLRPGAAAVPGQISAPYGMPELRRDLIGGAPIISNPGCYPTAILLALAPLVRAGLVPAGATISVAASSGVTGAGSAPRPELLFAEVAEDFRAYAPGNTHRHLAEMRAVLAELGAPSVDLIFTPHLLPVARGILATITVPVTAVPADPMAPWRDAYGGEPFIELVNDPPTLHSVTRRNVVRIAAMPVKHVNSPTMLVYAAIDNLVKGAAGQALQNANLMLGIPEATGLPA